MAGQTLVHMPKTEVFADRVVITVDRERRRRTSLLVGVVGAFFLLVGALVLVFHGVDGLAGALIVSPLGALLLWIALAPGRSRRVLVTRDGLTVETRHRGQSQTERYAAAEVDFVELHRRTRRGSEGREWTIWTFRLGLRDRRVLDVAESADRGRMRACAEAAHRLFQERSTGGVRLVAPSVAGKTEGASSPGSPDLDWEGKLAIEHGGDRVVVRVGGVRWGWFLGGSFFALAFLGVGVGGTAALVSGSLVASRAGEPTWATVVGLLFSVVPAVMAWWGWRLLVGCWLSFAMGSFVHVIRPGAIELHTPGAKEPDVIDLSLVDRLEVHGGNLALIARDRDVTLGFHRLSGAADLERARALVARLLESYGDAALR